MNFKEFILNEAPPGGMGGMGAPPGGASMGGMGDIAGGMGGSPLPTGGPGMGAGGPPLGGGLGGPPGGGMGGLGGGDPATQVPPKEIKSKNIWNVLEKILSSSNSDDTKSREVKATEKPKTSPKEYKSLGI